MKQTHVTYEAGRSGVVLVVKVIGRDRGEVAFISGSVTKVLWGAA